MTRCLLRTAKRQISGQQKQMQHSILLLMRSSARTKCYSNDCRIDCSIVTKIISFVSRLIYLIYCIRNLKAGFEKFEECGGHKHMDHGPASEDVSIWFLYNLIRLEYYTRFEIRIKILWMFFDICIFKFCILIFPGETSERCFWCWEGG